MAIDLRRRGVASSVPAARQIGLVDEVVPYAECTEGSDVIVLAVPVGEAARMLPEILGRPGMERKTVIDVCSTKSGMVNAADGHPMRGRYVATHPMAGTEYSGPWAAMSGLFDGKACVICDAGSSDRDAADVAEELYDALNMRIIHMEACNHDMHAAYVSHISHVTSFALALTVLKKEVDFPRRSGWRRAARTCGSLSWPKTGTTCLMSLTPT